jgi:hypothetical protein
MTSGGGVIDLLKYSKPGEMMSSLLSCIAANFLIEISKAFARRRYCLVLLLTDSHTSIVFYSRQADRAAPLRLGANCHRRDPQLAPLSRSAGTQPARQSNRSDHWPRCVGEFGRAEPVLEQNLDDSRTGAVDEADVARPLEQSGPSILVHKPTLTHTLCRSGKSKDSKRSTALSS